MQWAGFSCAKGVRLWSPASSMMMISPGLTSRTYFAPTRSKAQVSEATTQPPLKRPRAERPEPAGIADGNDPVPGQHDDAVGPLHPGEGLRQGLFQPRLQVGRHQVDDHLAVHRGLEDRSPLLELRPQLQGVDQVAVVAQGVVFVGMVDQKGLGVGEDGGARGGIADMADGQASGELREGILPEDLRGEPHPLVLPDLAAVRRGDPRAFLSPVLEGEQAEEGHPRRILVAVHRKDAALLVRFVILFVLVHDHSLPIETYPPCTPPLLS